MNGGAFDAVIDTNVFTVACAVSLNASSKVIINGGIFKSTKNWVLFTGNTSSCVINDGVFIAGKYALSLSVGTTVTVKGGSFTGATQILVPISKDSSAITKLPAKEPNSQEVLRYAKILVLPIN